MSELSNSALAMLVIGALLVVSASFLIRIDALPGLTGRATTDTGNVSLTVASALNIQVDAGNKTLAFGTCTPRSGTNYTCATNDAVACDGVFGANCTGDNVTPRFIRVQNVGNVNASVNVTSSCSAATLIGGTNPTLQFITTSCNGTNVSSWTTLDSTTRLACPQIVPTSGAFQLYVNVTIPQDAVGFSGGCTGISTLTFSAI